VPNCQHKLLHFFQNDENKLHVLDLERLFNNRGGKFEVINLNIDFKISHFHKSVITPFGDIFLAGGCHPNDIKNKLSSFYMVDYRKNTL